MTTSRTITTIRLEGAPGDPVLAALRDALAASHSVLGELGSGRRGERAYLLSGRDGQQLEVALLHPADEEGAMDLALLERLDARIPANEFPCPFCDRALRVWGRYCTRCGEDLSGVSAASLGLAADQMMAQVRAIARDSYDLLGAMPRSEGGGEVYFARDAETGRLVALRLETQRGTEPTDRHYTLGVTAIVPGVPATPVPPHPSPNARHSGKLSTGPGAAPVDILSALREQAGAEYEVLGEMGRSDGALFFLAREHVSGGLIALRLTPEDGGYSLNVHRRLDRRPGPEGAVCAGCGSRLDTAADTCASCGRPMSNGGRTAREREEEYARLRQLSEATAGGYEFIGMMERLPDESAVYFARRKTDGRIVGLRCERAKSFSDEGAVAIEEIAVMRALEQRTMPRPSRPQATPRPAQLAPPRTPSPPVSHVTRPVPRSTDDATLVPWLAVAAVIVLLVLVVVYFGSK